jgi:hypothetical protein
VLLFSLQTGASLYLKTPTLPITIMAVLLGRKLRKGPVTPGRIGATGF